MKPSSRKRALAALAISVSLHGVLGGWLRAAPAALPPALPPRPALSWFDVTPAREVKARPAPSPPASVKPAKVVAARARVTAPVAALQAPAQERHEALSDRPVSEGELPLPALAAPLLGGHTLHPEDLPSDEARTAAAAALVGQRVASWAHDDVLVAKARVGLWSAATTQLRRDLATALERGPDLGEQPAKHVAQLVFGDWRAGAERFGKTGAAYDPGPSWRRELDVPTTLTTEAQRGSLAARELATKFEAGARLRDFGAGKVGSELVALVEVRAGGAGPEVRLLAASSLALFDDWVVRRATEVVASADAGVAPRTVWRFTGRISYMRATSDLNAGKDWWYVSLAALSGMMTGTFDEVAGTAQYVDLRHPHFEATPSVVLEDAE